MIKISVIIPVYNVEKYLAECLDSIITQSLRDIEIICVNDASTDSSLNILQEYASKDYRVRVISYDENHGQAYARNLGLERAAGEYVYFVDADDMVKAGALDRMCVEAENDDVDLLCFDADVVYETEEDRAKDIDALNRYGLHRKNKNSYPDIYSGIEFFNRVYEAKDYDVTVWRQLWRRSYLEQNDLNFDKDTSPHEDYLFTFKALILADKVKCISESLYIYRRREGASTLSAITERRMWTYVLIHLKMMEFLQRFSGRIVSHEISWIRNYIFHRKEQIHKFIVDLFYKDVDVCNPPFSSESDKLMFSMLAYKDYGLIDERQALSLLREVCSYDNIIVYGAGEVARETIDLLLRYRISSLLVAVTDKDKTGNGQIYDIHELSALCHMARRSFVIIATTEKYWSDMIANCERLGFNRYGCIALL